MEIKIQLKDDDSSKFTNSDQEKRNLLPNIRNCASLHR